MQSELCKHQNDVRNLSKVKNKDKNDVIYVVLGSFLLTLNRFRALLWCFYCWLWLIQCWLGILNSGGSFQPKESCPKSKIRAIKQLSLGSSIKNSSEFKQINSLFFIRRQQHRPYRLKILLLILSKFKRINQFLFPLKFEVLRQPTLF